MKDISEKFANWQCLSGSWLKVIAMVSMLIDHTAGQLLRHRPLFRAIVGAGMLSWRWIAGLAFIPIGMYNGRRGFIQGPFAKYIFYAFYPLHLLVLYFIKVWLL